MKRCPICTGKGTVWNKLLSYDEGCDNCSGIGCLPETIQDIYKSNKLQENRIRELEYELGIGKYLKIPMMKNIEIQSISENETFKPQEQKFIILRIYPEKCLRSVFKKVR